MLSEDTRDQIGAVYNAVPSERLEKTACAADYNRYLVELVSAIVDQNEPNMVAALRTGVIRANDLFPQSVMDAAVTRNLSGSSSWTIEFAVVGDMPSYRSATRGRFLTWRDLELPSYLARDIPTPLGIAILFGNAGAVQTLVRAGAQPWPSPEALLNMALTRLTVTDYRVPTMGPPLIYHTHAIDVIHVLLRAFPRSRTLGPYDFNPLSVARMVTERASAFTKPDQTLVFDLFRQVVPLLLAAGYVPTDRIQAYPLSSRRQHDSEQARIEMTRMDEFEGAQENLNKAILYEQEGPSLSNRLVPYINALRWLLKQYAQVVAKPVVVNYASILPTVRTGIASMPLISLSHPRSPAKTTPGTRAQALALMEQPLQTQIPYSNDSAAAAGGLSQLPIELQALIAQQPALSNRDVAALAASSQNLAQAVALISERNIKRAHELVQPGGVCQDYVGCMDAFLYAIATDNVDTVEAILRTRRVRLDQYIDPTVVCGRSRNSVVLGYHVPMIDSALWEGEQERIAESGDESVSLSEGDVIMWVTQALYFYQGRSRDGIEIPYGWPYVSPLALAVALKAPRVLRYMIHNGAQPWPNMPTVLAFAMMYPLATHVTVAAHDTHCLLSATGAAQEGHLTIDRPEAFCRLSSYPPNLTRPVDTALITRILVEAFPSNGPSLGPWNITPLTIMRTEALSSARKVPPGYLDAVRAGTTLIAISQALFSGGYSPLQRSMRCALVTNTDLRASLDRPTEWHAAYDQWISNGSQGYIPNIGTQIDVIMNMYARHLLANSSLQ